jgi:transcriptional regulator with XRE-family HTH domain
MVIMRFSANLRRIIEGRRLSLTKISKATGIPMSTLSEWTAGREPKVSEGLLRLCKFLGLSLDELVGHEPQGVSPAREVAQAHVVIDSVNYQLIFKRVK